MKYACKRWHYSRSLPTPPLVRVGVWESGTFTGALIFSRGTSPALGRRYGLTSTEVCELSRVALSTHRTPVSRILAIAVRLLRKRCPGLRLVVSFADPRHGHVGTVYQGGGWIYTGTSAPDHYFVDPRGRSWHSRQLSSRQYGQRRAVPKRSECVAVSTAGKYRYVLPLDDELRQTLAPLAQPYPKREQSRENAAAGPPAEGGGIPTCSPQLGETADV